MRGWEINPCCWTNAPVAGCVLCLGRLALACCSNLSPFASLLTTTPSNATHRATRTHQAHTHNTRAVVKEREGRKESSGGSVPCDETDGTGAWSRGRRQEAGGTMLVNTLHRAVPLVVVDRVRRKRGLAQERCPQLGSGQVLGRPAHGVAQRRVGAVTQQDQCLAVACVSSHL